MSDDKTMVRFAPDDLSDGRQPGEWQTRYPDPAARKAIRFEALYVTAIFFLCPAFIFLIYHYYDESILMSRSMPIVPAYLFSWVGGLLGGTLFCLKWLYHSVAHSMWNIDRRLWRLLSPHMSAALAFIFICLIDSEIITIFNSEAIKNPSTVIAVSFLIGYFSDTALAKLSDVAYSLFGSSDRGKDRKRLPPRDASDGKERSDLTPKL